MLLLDFSPCIPAEGSGCGGFLTRTFDPTAESENRIEPASVHEVSAPNGRGAIRIVGDTIVVTARASGGKLAVPGRQIFDPLRRPVAVAVAPDSRYAFAVLSAKGNGVKSQVRMFDLADRVAVASLLIDGAPSGIAVAAP
jgi:hypothetical protein